MSLSLHDNVVPLQWVNGLYVNTRVDVFVWKSRQTHETGDCKCPGNVIQNVKLHTAYDLCRFV